MERLKEVSDEIKELISRKRQLEVRWRWAETRSEKLQCTKAMKAIDEKIAALRKEQAGLWSEGADNER